MSPLTSKCTSGCPSSPGHVATTAVTACSPISSYNKDTDGCNVQYCGILDTRQAAEALLLGSTAKLCRPGLVLLLPGWVPEATNLPNSCFGCSSPAPPRTGRSLRCS